MDSNSRRTVEEGSRYELRERGLVGIATRQGAEHGRSNEWIGALSS